MDTYFNRQSILVDAMRFPLIVMVLFAHSPREYLCQTVEWSADGWNVFHFVTELLSGHLCAIATRCFFLFSGFLFFRFMQEREFSLSWVSQKWKRRIHTLLIPFLLWNLIMVLAVLVKNYIFGAFSLVSSSDEMNLIQRGPVYWFFSGPADYPLWYVRDLMIMTLIAPLLFFIIKYMRWGSLVLLVLLYYSPIRLPILSIQALFYFGIGSWLGIHKTDFLPLCQKIKIPAAIAATVLLLLATFQVGRPMHLFLLKLFIPFGIITFVNICSRIIENQKARRTLCQLSGSVFFIYAAHEIYILGWTKGICLRLFGDSLGAAWLRYFLVPILVLSICSALYWALNKFMPRVLAFASGGRTS